MMATVQAYDSLGFGLDMSGFTNGVGNVYLTGFYLGTYRYDWDTFYDTWITGGTTVYSYNIYWRDVGSGIIIEDLFYYNSAGYATLYYDNIEVYVADQDRVGYYWTVDYLNGNDQIIGNRYADILKGGDGNDTVDGNQGNDKLYGEFGNDFLFGDEGADTITGGKGKDVFVFNKSLSTAGVDRITDFSVVDDTIRLENTFYKGIAAGALTPDAFRKNTTGDAADASDRIIYESDTGKLFYDQDGKGGIQKIQFATLNSGLDLTSADFFVI